MLDSAHGEFDPGLARVAETDKAAAPATRIRPRPLDDRGQPSPFRRLRARWLRWHKPRRR
jgi:hypothetical protein